MKLKLDLHVHTTKSPDAFTSIDKLPLLIKRSGLDGVAVTDHNILSNHFVEDGVIIPGMEISSAQGHVIGLGLSDSVPRGLPADDTIKEIHRLGGLAIIPHPYDLLRSSVRPETLTIRPDAIEVVNSSSFLHSLTWKKAREFAKRAGIPNVAGSDSHIPQTVGRAFTVVETDSWDIGSILDAIRKGSVDPSGRPIRALERVRKMTLALRSA